MDTVPREHWVMLMMITPRADAVLNTSIRSAREFGPLPATTGEAHCASGKQKQAACHPTIWCTRRSASSVGCILVLQGLISRDKGFFPFCHKKASNKSALCSLNFDPCANFCFRCFFYIEDQASCQCGFLFLPHVSLTCSVRLHNHSFHGRLQKRLHLRHGTQQCQAQRVRIFALQYARKFTCSERKFSNFALLFISQLWITLNSSHDQKAEMRHKNKVTCAPHYTLLFAACFVFSGTYSCSGDAGKES